MHCILVDTDITEWNANAAGDEIEVEYAETSFFELLDMDDMDGIGSAVSYLNSQAARSGEDDLLPPLEVYWSSNCETCPPDCPGRAARAREAAKNG